MNFFSQKSSIFVILFCHQKKLNFLICFGTKMGIKLFYLNFWILKKITFWNTINGRRIQKGASYGMGLSIFFCGCQPKKNVPVMAWDFQNFFCGCQPKKQGVSYGMSISKPYCFWGVPTQKIGASYGIEISKPYYYLVVFPKNGASYGMEPALFLFEGLPKKRLLFLAWNLPQKMCQLWHAFASYLFSFGGFPKKSVPVMAWKPIPLYLFRGGPIHLFIFGVNLFMYFKFEFYMLCAFVFLLCVLLHVFEWV